MTPVNTQYDEGPEVTLNKAVQTFFYDNELPLMIYINGHDLYFVERLAEAGTYKITAMIHGDVKFHEALETIETAIDIDDHVSIASFNIEFHHIFFTEEMVQELSLHHQFWSVQRLKVESRYLFLELTNITYE